MPKELLRYTLIEQQARLYGYGRIDQELAESATLKSNRSRTKPCRQASARRQVKSTQRALYDSPEQC
ncbi:MAG: hypothetical protein LBI92_09580 [Azoarcus sp.]|jgi:hypothetical protein|nr:hypothetical protein [Azoarcus sp.]